MVGLSVVVAVMVGIFIFSGVGVSELLEGIKRVGTLVYVGLIWIVGDWGVSTELQPDKYNINTNAGKICNARLLMNGFCFIDVITLLNTIGILNISPFEHAHYS